MGSTDGKAVALVAGVVMVSPPQMAVELGDREADKAMSDYEPGCNGELPVAPEQRTAKTVDDREFYELMQCPACVHHRPKDEPIPPWEQKP